MINELQTKFFTDHNPTGFALPEAFSLTSQYTKDWRLDVNPLSFFVSISFFAFNLIANAHNKILSSNQPNAAKFAEVFALSAISTVGITLLATIESIIRLVPGILGLLYLYACVDPKEDIKMRESSTLENIASFLYIGEVISFGTLLTAATSGYHMLTENSLYNIDKHFYFDGS